MSDKDRLIEKSGIDKKESRRIIEKKQMIKIPSASFYGNYYGKKNGFSSHLALSPYLHSLILQYQVNLNPSCTQSQ